MFYLDLNGHETISEILICFSITKKIVSIIKSRQEVSFLFSFDKIFPKNFEKKNLLYNKEA